MWRCSVLGAALLLTGCTQYPSGGNVRLHNDMTTQPVYKPQRDPRPLAEGAVPMQGVSTAPVPVSPASLAEGKKLFGIYCTPCHGGAGKGDGVVSPKLAKIANLTADKYLDREDVFFYGAIRNGSGLMPPQEESMSAAERWHVVNYLRQLQRP